MSGPPLARPTWRCPKCAVPYYYQDPSRVEAIHRSFDHICDPGRRQADCEGWVSYWQHELERAHEVGGGAK